MSIIFKALQRILGLRKFILVIGAAHTMISVCFLLPYNKAFRDFFSHRLVTETLASQNLYTYYAEFYQRMNEQVSSAMTWIQMGNLSHYFLMAFLTGGIISVMLMTSAVNVKEFYRNCRYYSWRMFKVALLTPGILIILFVAGVLLGLPLIFLLPDYFGEDQLFYFLLSYSMVISICILWGLLILDIVKVRMIENNEKKLGRMLLAAVQLFIKNPLRLMGYYLMMLFIWFVIVASYWIFQDFLSDRSAGDVIVELLIFQGFVFVQLWIRFARYDVIHQILCSSDMADKNGFHLPDQSMQRT